MQRCYAPRNRVSSPILPVPSGHDEAAAPPEGEAAVSPYVLPYYGVMLLLELVVDAEALQPDAGP
jgi:hypothetical protein